MSWLLSNGKLIAVLVVATALFAAVLVIYNKGERAGKAAEVIAVQKQTQKVQKRIDDAEAKGPRTPHDVSKRLRDGSF